MPPEPLWRTSPSTPLCARTPPTRQPERPLLEHRNKKSQKGGGEGLWSWGRGHPESGEPSKAHLGSDLHVGGSRYLQLRSFYLRFVFFINSVRTRCVVKGKAQKSPLFWRFSGVFDFSGSPDLRNSTRKPLNLVKSRIFTNTPCKPTSLYNAPSMHTVDFTHGGRAVSRKDQIQFLDRGEPVRKEEQTKFSTVSKKIQP